MKLVRDLLDKAVVDRHGREMGRVDGIVLEIRDGAPPRVDRLELGPAVLASRIAPWLRPWVEGLAHALGAGDGQPVRIRFEQIESVNRHVKVDANQGGA